MHNGIGKIASELKCMFHIKIEYKRAIVNRKIASSKKSKISVVQ